MEGRRGGTERWRDGDRGTRRWRDGRWRDGDARIEAEGAYKKKDLKQSNLDGGTKRQRRWDVVTQKQRINSEKMNTTDPLVLSL